MSAGLLSITPLSICSRSRRARSARSRPTSIARRSVTSTVTPVTRTASPPSERSTRARLFSSRMAPPGRVTRCTKLSSSSPSASAVARSARKRSRSAQCSSTDAAVGRAVRRGDGLAAVEPAHAGRPPCLVGGEVDVPAAGLGEGLGAREQLALALQDLEGPALHVVLVHRRRAQERAVGASQRQVVDGDRGAHGVPDDHLPAEGLAEGEAVLTIHPEAWEHHVHRVRPVVDCAGQEDRGGGDGQGIGSHLPRDDQPADDRPADGEVAERDDRVPQRGDLPVSLPDSRQPPASHARHRPRTPASTRR